MACPRPTWNTWRASGQQAATWGLVRGVKLGKARGPAGENEVERKNHLTISHIPGRIQPMAPKRTKLTDQLRQAIDAADRTRYRLALDAGIDHATMSRFMNGKGGFSMEVLDAIADTLGLELVVKRPAKRQAKKGR